MAEVQSVYPNLQMYRDGDQVLIRGSFPVLHEEKVLDRYLIEIQLLPNFPKTFPIVREIGGRIPRTDDYHMNSASGEACLFLPEEYWGEFSSKPSLLDFLNGPVRNFFIGQSLVEKGEPWPFGFRPHGNMGIIEYYGEILGTSDLTQILKYIKLLSKLSMKGHWECPCGSGKRLRKCHFRQLVELRSRIPPKIAKQSLDRLMKTPTNDLKGTRPSEPKV